MIPLPRISAKIAGVRTFWIGVTAAMITFGSKSKAQQIIKKSALLLLATSLCALPSQAKSEREKCAKRLEKAQAKLQKAVQKHGDKSKQAREKRRELENIRTDCRLDIDQATR